MWKHALATALLISPLATLAAESGINLENFDRTVRPQDDFYRYVNGHWLQTQKIPDDKSNYSSFSELSDRTEKQLLELIHAAAASGSAQQGEAQQVGALFSSFMDEKAVESADLAPLDADLLMIDRLSSHDQLPQLMGQLDWLGVQGMLGLDIGPDAQNPKDYILYVWQDGLGLPDREYYLEDSAKFKGLRKDYQHYVSRLLRMAGSVDADAKAKDILALETSLAQQHWTQVESRDAQKTYNRRALDTINQATPEFDFSAYLSALGLHSSDAVVIAQPSYFANIGKILAATPLETLREYFRLRLLDAYAPYLSRRFVDAHFAFHSQTLLGISSNRPRWKRGVEVIEQQLGEALGKMYVQNHFPPQAKARMQTMVDNLLQAYRISIKDLDWMGADTRKQALVKLDKFTTKIGYPDLWRSYAGLQIKNDDLVGNLRRSNRFAHQYHLNKLGQPINPNEWHMTPQTVNAYYNPVSNEIVFPAAILQPPFFDMAADDAVNYGGIGAVIGHEIGHGFDDQGSRYDGDGRLRNWWTEQDRERFEQRTHLLIAQYDGYSPLHGYQVNGALTIGENIGDLGGLSIAAKAYQLSLKGKAAPVLDGFDGLQRVMIGWAQIWRRLYYSAFDVKPSDGMYKPAQNQVTIW